MNQNYYKKIKFIYRKLVIKKNKLYNYQKKEIIYK